MFEQIRKNLDLIKVLVILLIVAVGSYVFNLAWNILGNFVDLLVVLLMAWLLSFVLEPVVQKIQHVSKLSLAAATGVAYFLVSLLVVAVVFVYIPLISSQIVLLTEIIPQYLSTAPPYIVNINNSFSTQLNNSITLIPSVAQFLFSAFIVLILSFYLIVDREKINLELYNLVPKRQHEILRYTQQVINDTFVSFLRVQLFFGVSTGIITWIILRIFGIDFALSIAMLAGLFGIVPLIGPVLAIVLPVLLALLSNSLKALIIGILLLITQEVLANIVGPKLLGKAFKLHPAIILISFLVGLKFAGILGAVFAIPVLGIGAIMIRRFGLLGIRGGDRH